MNEQDFKNELRRTMATLPARQEMNDAVVLDAARRDLRRRRTVWAGAGSAAAVVAVAVGVAILAPSATDGGRVQVGDQPPASTRTTADVDRGAQLLAGLRAVLPAGYAAPADLTGADGRPLTRNHPNHDAASGDGTTGWAYTAAIPLTKGGGVGELSVTVFAPNEARNGRAGCELNPGGWNPRDCTATTVAGRPVGVFTATVDGHAVQHAVHQYEDGTLVAFTQAAAYRWAGTPALPDLPLNTEQLTALVTDSRFTLR